jgi:rubrerythrin
MNIDMTPAQAKALIREIEGADLTRHPAVDELVEAVAAGLKKDDEDNWDCEWCGQQLETVEDFETMKCPSCRQGAELMEIGDIRAIIREMQRESLRCLR